jgi:hypothetical protein
MKGDLKIEILGNYQDDLVVKITYVDGQERLLHLSIPSRARADLTSKELLNQIRAVIEREDGHGFDVPHVMPVMPATPVPAPIKSPPQTAEWLFAMFAPTKSADAQLGDLQEMFENDSKRVGTRRAERLYWTRVIRSIAPAAWQKLKKLGWLGIIIDYGRTKLGF